MCGVVVGPQGDPGLGALCLSSNCLFLNKTKFGRLASEKATLGYIIIWSPSNSLSRGRSRYEIIQKATDYVLIRRSPPIDSGLNECSEDFHCEGITYS
jgi:hypothetical protein